MQLALFGSPKLELGGQPLNLPTKRAWGLVAYLALEGATTREVLAELLWDETWFADPRKNLRQELYRLSKSPLAPFLELDELVVLHCTCDARLIQASSLPIVGEFLPRFDVPQAPQFQHWLETQRQTFRALRLSRLEAQASRLTGVAALGAWLEVLGVDSLRETAVQAALRLEAEHLGNGAALERYNGFKALLKQELGLEPLPETLALATELGLEKSLPSQTPSDTRVQRVLEAASLLAQPFRAEMLLDVVNLPDFEVLDALETAIKNKQLQRLETGYSLLVPQTARTLTAERRRILERRLAKRLTALGAAPEIIATHLAKAGERRLAANKYIEAAELATRQHRRSEALEQYALALRLDLPPEQQFMVLQARIFLCKADARIWREAVRDLEKFARSQTAEHRAVADLQRALWHLSSSEYQNALEFVAPHLDKSGKVGAMAAYLQGTILVKTGKLPDAETFLQRALEHKNVLEDVQTAETHNVLCVLDVQRNQLQAAKIHNQASLKGFARSGHDLGLTRALSTAGVLEMLGGQHQAAQRMFKRSLELAIKINDTTSQIATLLNLSKTYFETLNLDASHAYLAQGLELLETHPDTALMSSYLVNIAAIERLQLKLDSAWTRVSKALQLAQEQQAAPKIASRALVLCSMALERHRYAVAQEYIDSAALHITPELAAELILQKAHLALCQQRPQQTLDLLQNQNFTNDDLEYRAALMAFAYLKIQDPQSAKIILDFAASSLYSPFVQAARIETHAMLGTLETSHFEPAPNKNSVPFMRYSLNLAFANHAPDKQKYTRLLKQLEARLAAMV